MFVLGCSPQIVQMGGRGAESSPLMNGAVHVEVFLVPRVCWPVGILFYFKILLGLDRRSISVSVLVEAVPGLPGRLVIISD